MISADKLYKQITQLIMLYNDWNIYLCTVTVSEVLQSSPEPPDNFINNLHHTIT